MAFSEWTGTCPEWKRRVQHVDLRPKDLQHLRAAEGWIELNDHLSAFEELEEIQPLHRAHPDVLKLRWRIYAKAQKWGSAFAIAEGLTRLLPDDVQVYVWRSYSARRMDGGSILMALQLLLDVANDFPDEPVVPFNLACYNAALNKLAEAHTWLRIALQVAERNGTEKQWKQSVLDDPDLEPLRKEVSL